MHSSTFENTFQEELYSVPPKTVVAIKSQWHELSEEDKVLLEKILSSVRLSGKHVKIITTAQLDVLKWTDQPSHVLAFGLEMPGIALFEPFEVQGIQIIISPSLNNLDQDKDGKQKLWVALKKFYV